MNNLTVFNDDYENLFYLMNKNIKIAKFTVLGKEELEHIEILEHYSILPSWLNNTANFIQNRKVPQQRENIKELLELSGCNTLIGYLNITHALSLVDTFWVCPVDSTIAWEDISLYTHEFNEVIARTAFEGGLHGYGLDTISPEYGTNGSFAKCWIRENNQIKLLKRGSSGARNAGLEPYSEFLACQLASALELEHVNYNLRTHHDRLCSVCDIFTSEELGYLPFNAIDNNTGGNLGSNLKLASEYGIEKEFRDMIVFDGIIMNEDRHKGNFGFLINNETQSIVGAAPLFDHNISLLCYAEENELTNKKDFDDYVKMKGPRIGETFVNSAKAVLTTQMRNKLINLKGFMFKNHDKLDLPEWRIEALNKIVNNQIELILKK